MDRVGWGRFSSRCCPRFVVASGLGTLTFHAHPLFTEEHVRASELKRLWTEYESRLRLKLASYLLQKLKTLKDAARQVEEQIADDDTAPVGDLFAADSAASERHLLARRLASYRSEIKRTREQWNEEEKVGIPRTWRAVVPRSTRYASMPLCTCQLCRLNRLFSGRERESIERDRGRVRVCVSVLRPYFSPLYAALISLIL